MIVYFHGEDTFAARQAIDAKATKEKATLVWLEAAMLDEKSLAERMHEGSQGLFGKNLLVIRDPSRFPVRLQRMIIDTVKLAPPGLCIIWEREKSDARTELVKTLKKNAHHFPALEEDALYQWIREEGKRQGVILPPAAAATMVATVGSNRFALLQEIHKVALMETIPSAEQIRDETGTIFTLIEALAAGDVPRVLRLTDQILEGGENELYILSMVAYQFRTLLTLRMAVDARTPSSHLSQKTGISSFVVSKSMRYLQRYTTDELLAIVVKLLATDHAIKRGAIPARTALLLFLLTTGQEIARKKVFGQRQTAGL